MKKILFLQLSLISCILFLTSYFFFPSPTLAQVPIRPQFKGPFDSKDIAGIGDLVSLALANAYIIAGVLLLVFILLGGIGMISGAGSNDNQKKAQSRMAVTWAVLGFLIIFASYWIIQIVEAISGVDIL